MIITKEIDAVNSCIDKDINKFLEAKRITREELIDIKYNAIANNGDLMIIAFIIYEKKG